MTHLLPYMSQFDTMPPCVGMSELSLDDNGEVSLEDGYIIGKSTEIFGDKIFEDVPRDLYAEIEKLPLESVGIGAEPMEKLKQALHTQAVKTIVETAKEQYGSDMKASDRNRMESKMKEDASRIVDRAYTDYAITQKVLEKERQELLENCVRESTDWYHVNREYDERQQEAIESLVATLKDSVDEFVHAASQEVVKTVETKKKEQEKKGYEDTIRDHLRGFSRTIPSFLMAYGDDTVTLANFDKIIPDAVFLEVTSITLAQFCFLRDGGSYVNAVTGEEEFFEGKLFDPVVFDDSVKEFLRMKEKLADYFNEEHTEDIFDYIPPQKTNQIFTPKWVVKKMVDMLAEENPGCFDRPDATFIDPYMKSGMYITEIVKRLYQSEAMKRCYPEDGERLRHIFEKQVYGLAPTEIIYRIALKFILGFAEKGLIRVHNFRQADALQYAKNGNLEEMLDEVYKG